MDLGRLLFRIRNPLAALPLVYALFSTRWEWEAESAIWGIGITLAVAGVAMRAWATCHCSYSSGRKKTLAVTGPYAHIRNPLYVGNVLIILGAVVASELAWFVPIAAVWSFGVYAAVATYEDRVMVAKFGDEYRRYRARIPAWIPIRPTRSIARVGTGPRFALAFIRQAANLIWLGPFVLKELSMFGLGSGG